MSGLLGLQGLSGDKASVSLSFKASPFFAAPHATLFTGFLMQAGVLELRLAMDVDEDTEEGSFLDLDLEVEALL